MQLPEELERVIEQQVAEGRAASRLAFLEEAVSRLIDDASAEETAIQQAAQAGMADIEAGRFTTVATPDDARCLQARLMARVRDRLVADG